MSSLNRHQFRTYFHGTHPRNVESIKQEGLKVSEPRLREPDPDEWEDAADWRSGYPPGVYLTQDIRTARDYGRAVFSVELPDSAKWGHTDGSDGVVLLHGIHPYMLKQVE